MDQLLESKGKSGDSMAANLGEEEQTQKGKEVGDQQKEQQAEAEAIEEDDHEEEEEEEEEDHEEDDQENNHEEEDDNEDESAIEHLKSVPKVTNTQTPMLLKNVVTILTLCLHFCHHHLKRGCLLRRVTHFLSFFFPFHCLRFF